LEVLEYIRSHESVREIPVVMFTTSADGKDRKRALALGAEAFLKKLRTYDELTTELSAVCTRFLGPSHTRSDRKDLGGGFFGPA
jgi:CheY-like chemotaxis protein